MKSAVAIRHLAFEDLGLLEPLLKRRGYATYYYDAGVHELWTLDLDKVDLLIVLGGPIGAYDDAAYPVLHEELALITQRLESGQPMLGICLGAQLIACAMGATVTPMGSKEIGYGPVELTAAGQTSPLAPLAEAPLVLHWHGDQFAIPARARRLAGSAVCPNQAFARGPNVLGLQFHLETDPARLEQWLIGHAAELGAAGLSPATLRAQARDCGKVVARTADAVFNRWLDQLQT